VLHRRHGNPTDFRLVPTGCGHWVHEKCCRKWASALAAAPLAWEATVMPCGCIASGKKPRKMFFDCANRGYDSEDR